MLLTVTIPTYRRPLLLTKTLRNICSQINGKANVAVHIYDDSDGTENKLCVESVRLEYPDAHIEYNLNKRNLGIDENIKQCLITTKSDYVWLMGEDDLLTEGAISKVLSVITKNNPIFIFGNYIYSDDEHKNFSKHPVIPESSKIYSQNFNDFSINYIWTIGFIGSCIVRTKDFRNQDLDRFIDSYYSHVGGIINTCIDREIFIIEDILTINRAEDINTFTWSKKTFEVYFSFYEVLKKSKLSDRPLLLESCMHSASKLFSVFSLGWLAAKRADGVYDTKTLRMYYTNNIPKGKIWLFFAWLIACLPQTPLKWLRKIHLKHRFSRKSL